MFCPVSAGSLLSGCISWSENTLSPGLKHVILTCGTAVCQDTAVEGSEIHICSLVGLCQALCYLEVCGALLGPDTRDPFSAQVEALPFSAAAQVLTGICVFPCASVYQQHVLDSKCASS